MDGSASGAGAEVDRHADGGARAPYRAALVDAEQIPDITAFEAALRAYFDAAIHICSLPSVLPFPRPDEDMTAIGTLTTERSQRDERRRQRAWTKR